MKKLFVCISIAGLASCNPSNTDTVSPQEMIVGRTWKTVEYKSNGTADPTVVAQQPTFEFRNDGKMYFTQVGPVYKDTLNYSFTDATTIRLTKPQISGTAYTDFKVDDITSTTFHFTVSSNQNADIDNYKTVKQ